MEPLLTSHLSYKATLYLYQRWSLNTGLNVYLIHWQIYCMPLTRVHYIYKFIFPGILCIYIGIVSIIQNGIGSVMVNVFSSSAVDRGFEPRSGQTKDYKISMCCFFAKHVAFKRKSKDWLARNWDNVFE
jgi:hypothetical protein